MKRILLFTAMLCFSKTMAQPSKFIHLDQFGYLANANKVAVLSDPQTGYNASESYSPGSLIEVRDFQTQAVIFSAAPSLWNSGATHGSSGDRGWWFDFSPVTAEGVYFINDPSTGEKSGAFRINANPYREVLKAALKMFYYNRCNHNKEAPYADAGWTDGMNFRNALQDGQCRLITDPNNTSLEKDLTGGWFDAGDYNKYVTFANSAVHNLLAAYENHAGIFGDDWNWPESGNGLPDILDELKWELDWLMKMSNPNGTAQIKMGSNSHNTNASAPPSINTDQRYYGPECTAASIAIASMFAHAAKVFANESGMQTYAQSLQARAISCWNHFLFRFNSNNLDTGCDDGSIVAGDADWTEDEQKGMALVAATYLFELTGDADYNSFIMSHYDEVEPVANFFWGPYRMEVNEALLLYTTLSGADPTTSSDILSSAATDINNNNNGFFTLTDDDLYRIGVPDWMYHWGSNMPIANVGNLCLLLRDYNVVPAANNALEERAAEQLHYFHGVNPQGLVQMSNMYTLGGDRCVNEIYHTWFADQSVWDHAINSDFGPPPGFVTGGANKDFSLGHISPPSGQPPQKSYLDFNTNWPDNSWEISEPAIYYQAAFVRLLANYVNNSSVTTTIENLQANNQCIEIFPNPTGQYFHVRGILDKYDLGIYDAGGTLHQNIGYIGSEAVVDISALPGGTYFIRIENKSQSELCVQKILKE